MNMKARWPAEWVWVAESEGVYPDNLQTKDLASFYEDAKSNNGRRRRRRRLRNRRGDRLRRARQLPRRMV